MEPRILHTKVFEDKPSIKEMSLPYGNLALKQTEDGLVVSVDKDGLSIYLAEIYADEHGARIEIFDESRQWCDHTAVQATYNVYRPNLILSFKRLKKAWATESTTL